MIAEASTLAWRGGDCDCWCDCMIKARCGEMGRHPHVSLLNVQYSPSLLVLVLFWQGFPAYHDQSKQNVHLMIITWIASRRRSNLSFALTCMHAGSSGLALPGGSRSRNSSAHAVR